MNILADAKTEQDCLATGGNQQSVGPAVINGAEFQVFTDGDAAMSHRSEGFDYRAFRNGTCWQLTTRVNTTVFEVWAPGLITRFTDADQKLVEEMLGSVIKSFKFE